MRCVERGALVSIFMAVQNLACQLGISICLHEHIMQYIAVGQAVLIELIQHVPAAGEITHQHPLAIAYRFRGDVFVGMGVLQHR